MFPKSEAFGVLFVLTLAVVTLDVGVYGQIAYTRHLSDLRIRELQNLATRLEHSVVNDTNPCDDYFVHVCSRNRPMFSIMGNMPSENNILRLLIDLQNDEEVFEAKSMVTKFSISCGAVKSVDDCYRETFNFFRPLFGYIVAKKHLESQDYKVLLELLDRFLAKVNVTEHFGRHSLRYKLEVLKDKLKQRHDLFKIADLNKEYESVKIYADSYDHNVKSLEELHRTNSSYKHGINRAILDWNLYLYQSRHKPMSYYYATLNVHLWMMFYNSSSRMDQRKYEDKADCLKLPAALNALEEARLLSVIYIQSFNNAWVEYRQWITSTATSQEIYNHENEILKPYQLDNKRLFFTLYAQNFCDFGKSLAESVFFLGLKQNIDFYNVYKCGYQTMKSLDCLARQ